MYLAVADAAYVACTSSGAPRVAPSVGLVIVTVPAKAAGAMARIHMKESIAVSTISTFLLVGDDGN
jgi:hypothetical protein